MKTKKNFFVILMVIMSLLVSCGQKEGEYEDRLLSISKESLENMDIDRERTYNVTCKGDMYEVTINGETQLIKFEENEEEKLSITDIEAVDTKMKKLISKSRKKVIKYVETSKILKEKDKIIQQLEKIQFKKATVDSPALYEDGVIYIGKDYQYAACEWMMCHELVHAIAEITNRGIEKEVYAYYTFNEVVTDVITFSMEPDISGEFMSAYMEYYDIIFKYIGCFKEEALKAYFYGYEELWKKTDKIEFNFFVYSIENYYQTEFAVISIYSTINKWAMIADDTRSCKRVSFFNFKK